MAASVQSVVESDELSIVADGGPITVPDAALMFAGDYSRDGGDLLITGADGTSLTIVGYFEGNNAQALRAPNGATLTSDVVNSLAGPRYPGQYAQATQSDASGLKEIGKVVSLEGSATAVRPDGTVVQLKIGDPVFQGDVIQTGGGSKLGLGFLDGTVFSMTDNARMVLDELVYSPDGQDNSMLFNIVQGTFVFVAGQVAPTGDMQVKTPVATMGIRGTIPTVGCVSGDCVFSLVPETDAQGNVVDGSYDLFNLNGDLIGQVTSSGEQWSISLLDPSGNEVEVATVAKSADDIANDANAINNLNTVISSARSYGITTTKEPAPVDSNADNGDDGTGDDGNGDDGTGDDGTTESTGDDGTGDDGTGDDGDTTGSTENAGDLIVTQVITDVSTGELVSDAGETGSDTGAGTTNSAATPPPTSSGDIGPTDNTFVFNPNPTPVPVTNPAPVISLLNGDLLAFIEGNGPRTIDFAGNATVTDTDSIDFDSGILTVSIASGVVPGEDQLGIQTSPTAGVGIEVSGATISLDGAAIGTFTGGGAGGGNLVVTFNANATPAAAQTLLRAITYFNSGGDTPTGGNRSVTFRLTDGDGNTSNVATATVSVTPVNDFPQGLFFVTGIQVENQTLTANVSNITDADGLGVFSFQWQRSIDGGATFSNIAGATGQSYTLGDADGGQTVRVLASYTDGQGTLETLISGNLPIADPPNANPDVNAITEGALAEGATFGGTTSDFSIVSNVQNVPSGDYSVSFWANDSIAGTQNYISYAVAGSLNELVVLKEGGTLRFHANNTGGGPGFDTGAVVPSDGEWHNITFTVDTTSDAGQITITAFVDGVEAPNVVVIPNSVGPNTLAPNGTLVLGQEQDTLGGGFDPGSTLTGSLADVAFFDGKLSAGDIALIATGTAEPGGTVDPADAAIFLRWNDATQTFEDISGGGNDMVTNGNVVTANDAVPAQDIVFGNVLDNDTDLDNTVPDDLSVTQVNGNAVATTGQTEIVGTFGSLFIKADGTYAYRLDRTNRSVLELTALSVALTEVFNVTVSDGALADTNTLTITINGDGETQVGDNTANVINGDQSAAGVNDFIDGQGGNDTLAGLDGNDVVFGGDGDDLIIGGSGNGFDIYDGEGDNDTVTYQSTNGGVNANLATGVATGPEIGNDLLLNIENLTGGSGNDVLIGDGGDNVLIAGDGIDFLQGGGGDDTLIGGTRGSNAADSNAAVFSDASDQLTVPHIIGSVDTASNEIGFAGPHDLVNGEAVTYNLAGGTAIGGLADGTEYFAIVVDPVTIRLAATQAEAISATPVNLTSAGSGGSLDTVNGIRAELEGPLGTESHVFGGASIGTDTLINIDMIVATTFDDVIIVDDGFRSQFSGGTDRFFQVRPGAGDDLILGNGSTRVSYQDLAGVSGNAGVTVDLAAGTGGATNGADAALVGADRFAGGVTQVTGSDFDDVLTGSDRSGESFRPLGGTDTIDGGGGLSDRLDYRNSPNTNQTSVQTPNGLLSFAVVVDLSLDADGLTGDAASSDGDGIAQDGFGFQDTILGGIEQIRGSEFDDHLTGDGANNQIFGRSGNDYIFGGDGNDFIRPDAGNDYVDGGAGNADFVAYGSEAEQGDINGFQPQTGVTVNLDTLARFGQAAGTATDSFGDTDTLVNIERVRGTDFDDRIAGNAQDNLIQSRDGFDILRGLAGDDVLIGGTRGATIDGTRADYRDATDTLDRSLILNSVDTGTDQIVFAAEHGLVTGEKVTYTDGGAPIGNLPSGDYIVIVVDDFRVQLAANQADALAGTAINLTSAGDGSLDTANGIRAELTGPLGSASSVFGGSLVGTDTLINVDQVFATGFNDVVVVDASFRSQFANGTSNFAEIAPGAGDDVIIGNGGTRIGFGNINGFTTTAGVTVNMDDGTGSGFGNAFATNAADANLVGFDIFTGVSAVRGTNFDDIVFGRDGAGDTIRAQQGNDYIDGGAGGGDRADYRNSPNGITVDLSAQVVSTLIPAGPTVAVVQDGFGTFDELVDIERIRGSEFADTITGDAGNNRLEGRDGNDNLFGGDGDDTLDPGAGTDLVDGGIGNDWVQYQNEASNGDRTGFQPQAGVTINLNDGTAVDPYGNTDILVSIENARGTAFDDLFIGDASANVFEGLAGFNRYIGRGGADTFIGGTRGDNTRDFDTVDYRNAGGPITATLTGALNSAASSVVLGGVTDTLDNIDRIIGTNFADTFTVDGTYRSQFGGGTGLFNEFEGMGGNDLINGNGSTRIGYGFAAAAVTVDFLTGQAISTVAGDAAGIGTDSFNGANGTTAGGVNSVRGSAFGDTLLGSNDPGFELFRGQAGDDFIDGRGGSNDQADYRNSPDGIFANLDTGAFGEGTVEDGFGDTDTLMNIERIRGSEFDDVVITHSTGANRVEAQGGDDVIIARGGSDILDGGDGNDLFIVSPGHAWVIDGGDGTDTLRLAGAANFDARTEPGEAEGIEIIDLNRTDANTLTIDPDSLFEPSGSALRVLGTSADTLNVTSTAVEVSPQTFVSGVWQQNGTITEVHNGFAVTFDTFEFVDDLDDVIVTTHVQQGIQINVAPPPSVGIADVLAGSVAGLRAIEFTGLSAGDGAGSSVARAGDINGDGFEDVIVGAYNANQPSRGDTGIAYVVLGGSGLASSIALGSLVGGFEIQGVTNGDKVGARVAGFGDVNGDGISDIIVSAPGDDGGGADRGQTSVVYGGQTTAIDLSALTAQQGVSFDGIANGNETSGGVLGGDFNGDGIADIAMGAAFGDGGGASGANRGETYLVFGDQAFAASFALSSLDGTNGVQINGVADGDFSGSAITFADINGDGIDDLVTGAPFASPNANNQAGQVHVIFGGQALADPFSLANLNGAGQPTGFRIDGLAANDRLGSSVAYAGDVNGDGVADLVIGASNLPVGTATGAGAAYLIFGDTSGFGSTFDLATLNGGNGYRLNGIDLGDRAGVAVSSAGDVNGDGFDDVLIGTEIQGQPGEAYLLFGGQTHLSALDAADGLSDGAIQLTNLDGVNGTRLVGDESGDLFGNSVSSAGDIDGDGFDDVIVGARLADTNPVDAGAAYVVFGGNFSFEVTQEGTSGGETLNGTTNAVDVIVAGAGNDTVTNIGDNGGNGEDVARLGAGDDTVEVTGLDIVRLDGGTGLDTLLLDGLSVDLTGISNLAVQSFEAVDLRDGTTNSLTLDLTDVFDLSETGNSDWANLGTVGPDSTNNLVIFGEGVAGFNPGDDAVVLQGAPAGHPQAASGGWVADGQTTFSSTTFDVFNFTTDGSPGGTVLASVAIQQEVDTTAGFG